MYEAYPIANRVFSIAVTTFILYNFASWAGSITSHPLYVRWLNISEPFTNVAAEIFPGIDSSTAYLNTRGASHMVPEARNLLSINFAMFLLLPSCFAVAACVDLFNDRDAVLRRIDIISKRIPMPINEIGVRGALFVLILFPPIYFGLASDPYITSIGVTIAYYVIAFGVNCIALIVVISCVISLAAVRLKAITGISKL